MKYKSIVQNARRKYLQQQPLSDNEKELIEKDFRGKDYAYYQSIKEKEIILPEKYSAEATFLTIGQAIRPGKSYLHLARYAAAVTLLIITTFAVYQLNKAPENILVSTSFGERKQIELPDGSTVILNSLSTVSYPENMHKAKMRQVELEGEAYFDIKTEKQRPFIVNAAEVEIKVSGTKFNVSAYQNDENITTSLYEGAVSVSFGSGNTLHLKPGEQAICNKKNGQIEHSIMEDVNQNAWIKGSMHFENVSLNDIFKILEREKNMTFKISDDVNKELKLTAKFNNNESVEEILEHLSRSGGFEFEKKEETYWINKQKH